MLNIGLEKPKTRFLGISLRWNKMHLCQNKKPAKALALKASKRFQARNGDSTEHKF